MDYTLGIKQDSGENARRFTKLLPLAPARLRFNKSFRLLNKVTFNIVAKWRPERRLQ